MSTTTLLVQKDRPGNARIDMTEAVPLADGQVRVRVESFALTSNNITYAAFGDAMHYWQFFPTREAGWGIVPVWGFGTVVETLQPGIAVGERLYGYWPMASEAVLQPGKVGEKGFVDASAHRAPLAAVYNQYLRCSHDPFYTGASEDLQSLLRPLFITSWLIDDFMADNGFFGARTVMLSSASSKTAFGTAFMLSQRPGIDVVGFTSPGNRAFCESLGCYTRVLTYDEAAGIDEGEACVYIDFAGNADFRRKIHARFANLKYSCSVGGTHIEQLGGAKDLPGPRATLFFAPAQIQKRQGDWGAAELGRKLVAGWQAFLTEVSTSDPPWVEVRRHEGPDAVLAAYALVYEGRGDPRVGHVLSLA